MAECEVCKEPARSRCSKCKTVSYCSREHQKHDWKSHRSVCFRNESQCESSEEERGKESIPESKRPENLPYSLEPLEHGLCMIASKDLEPGETIFSEVPGKIGI